MTSSSTKNFHVACNLCLLAAYACDTRSFAGPSGQTNEDEVLQGSGFRGAKNCPGAEIFGHAACGKRSKASVYRLILLLKGEV